MKNDQTQLILDILSSNGQLKLLKYSVKIRQNCLE